MVKRHIAVVLVLLLFPAYVWSVGALPSSLPQQSCNTGDSGPGQNVGFCFEVSASVERNYYFGLLEMDTRVLGVDVNPLNRLAAPGVLFLAALTKTLIWRGNET